MEIGSTRDASGLHRGTEDVRTMQRDYPDKLMGPISTTHATPMFCQFYDLRWGFRAAFRLMR